MTIPGVGPITSTAITALVPAAQGFRAGRHFAAWLGLTPVQKSTGGKQRLGAVSKRGGIRSLARKKMQGICEPLWLTRVERGATCVRKPREAVPREECRPGRINPGSSRPLLPTHRCTNSRRVTPPRTAQVRTEPGGRALIPPGMAETLARLQLQRKLAGA
jgi:transposase IS116/IS110/IS902 family protein